MIDKLQDIINNSGVLDSVPKLLGTRILVAPIEKENSYDLLITMSNDNQHWGVVISKGDDVISLIELGSVVYWSGDVGESFPIKNSDYHLMDYRELKAIY